MRKVRLFSFLGLICFCLVTKVRAQQWFWSEQESTNTSVRTLATVTNDNGDVFACGRYSGSSSIGGVSLTPVGTSDMFLVKYNNVGTPQWTVGFGSASAADEYAYCTATDTSGNVYVGGIVNNTFTLGSVTVNPAVTRGFVLKFNSSGVAQWVCMIGSNGSALSSPSKLIFDKANNRLIAGGDFTGTGYFGSYTLTGPGAQESYITAIDAVTGNVQWASNVVRSTGTDPITALTLDDNGNIFAAGHFGSSSATIGNQPLSFSNGGSCIAKFRSDGSYVNCYATVNMYFDAVGFNQVTGEVYAGGSYHQSFTEGIFTLNRIGTSVNADIFVCRIDTFVQPISYTWIQSTDDDYITAFCVRDDGLLLGVQAGGQLLVQSNMFNTNGYTDGMVYMKFDEGLLLCWGRTIVGTYYAQRITSISASGNYVYMNLFFRDNITCNNISAYSADMNSLTIRLIDEHWNYAGSAGGWVFNDPNANGNVDSGENFFHHYHMVRNRTDSMLVLTDANGHYYRTVQPGPNELEIVHVPLYHTLVHPTSPGYHTINSGPNSYIDSVNFGLVSMPGIQDMEIVITGPSSVRSGNPVRYYIDYFNRGTDTMNGYVVMNFDPGLGFTQSSPSPDSVSGYQLFWNYSQLSPLYGSQIDVDFYVNILPLNSPVVNNVIVEPVIGDTTPLNNYDTCALIVTGPHDPNNKVVLPAGGISPQDVAQGTWLDYTINFQNVGTAAAINVVVRDTLSDLLDITSFEFICSSDNVQITLLPSREIEFRFTNINLPDSASDLLGSQGFVRFRIKPVPTAVVGDIIKNNASIYFDYEFPVVTNSTTTPVQIITTTSVTNPEDGLSVFPNPSGDLVNIQSSSPVKSVVIFSLAGELLSENFYRDEQGLVQVNTIGISPGLVIMKVSTKEGEAFVRLVVLHQ